MSAGHLSRERGVGGRWGTSDWAIRSVSLWGHGKVMKSGGEPSSSLKHKFSKRLHGLLGRWAPSFLVRESENSVRVWSAEDASVGFGWSPVTKVNIWAKSLLESDLVCGRERKTACVSARVCASLLLPRTIKHCLLHVSNLPCCSKQDTLTRCQSFKSLLWAFIESQTYWQRQCVNLHSSNPSKPPNYCVAIALMQNSCVNKCLVVIVSGVNGTQKQQHCDALGTLKITVRKFVLYFFIRS